MGQWPLLQSNTTHPQQIISQLHSFPTLPDLQLFIHKSQLRTRTYLHAARIVSASISGQSNLCGQGYLAEVSVEKVPNSLPEKGSITQTRILQILHAASIGYEEIQETYEDVDYMICPEMIRLDKRNQVRVWFHQDFSVPFPQFPTKPGLNKQHDLLQNLLNIGQNLLSNQTFSLAFNRIRQNHPDQLTFYSFRSILKQAIQQHSLRLNPASRIVKKGSHNSWPTSTQYTQDVKCMQSFSLKSRPKADRPKTTGRLSPRMQVRGNDEQKWGWISNTREQSIEKEVGRMELDSMTRVPESMLNPFEKPIVQFQYDQ